MIRVISFSLVIACYLTMTGCVYEMGMREEFERSMRAYNRMLRWQEVENAGMTYIVREQRDDFMRNAELFRKRGVTLTDFRILTFECLPDKKTGEVITEFDYFILPSNRIKTLSYRQQWVYQDILKNWKLKSGLPAFE